MEAVRGINLTVQTGEIFAFLGPNGAGKTTTVEMLEGYRRRDAGEVTVLGADPAHPSLDWRARLGVVLQTSKMPDELTVRELVERYAGFYPHPRDIGEMIELVGLADKRKARAHKLSGGQLRRLDVALVIVGDPDLMFLDEPTTGFDPAASLGAGRGLARAGQDGLYDHAQHGRGRGARRPSGSDREGFHRRSRRVPSSPRAPPRPWAVATSRPWRSASPTLLGRRFRCLRT